MDGAFCRWAASLRQPGTLLHAWWLGPGSSSSSTPAGPPAEPPLPNTLGSSGRSQAAQAPGCPPSWQPSCHMGSRLRLDYTFDDQLGPLRVRFSAVRLRSAAGLQQLVSSGHAYAERLQARGVWAAWLAGGPVPRP